MLWNKIKSQRMSLSLRFNFNKSCSSVSLAALSQHLLLQKAIPLFVFQVKPAAAAKRKRLKQRLTLLRPVRATNKSQREKGTTTTKTRKIRVSSKFFIIVWNGGLSFIFYLDRRIRNSHWKAFDFYLRKRWWSRRHETKEEEQYFGGRVSHIWWSSAHILEIFYRYTFNVVTLKRGIVKSKSVGIVERKG